MLISQFLYLISLHYNLGIKKEKEELRLNIVLLIGRLTHDVEIKEYPNGNVARVTLAVRREFKNSDGLYDTDFFPITLWEGIATTCKEYCRKGSLISIKCRLQMNRWESSDGKTNNTIELIGETITLLTPNKIQSKE